MPKRSQERRQKKILTEAAITAMLFIFLNISKKGEGASRGQIFHRGHGPTWFPLSAAPEPCSNNFRLPKQILLFRPRPSTSPTHRRGNINIFNFFYISLIFIKFALTVKSETITQEKFLQIFKISRFAMPFTSG